MNLVRLRAVQLTAAAALLLSMVQLGGMITGESMTPTGARGIWFLEDGSGCSARFHDAGCENRYARARGRPVRIHQLGSGFGSIGAKPRASASTGQTVEHTR